MTKLTDIPGAMEILPTELYSSHLEVDVEAMAKILQNYLGIIEVTPKDMAKEDVAELCERVVNWSMTNGLAEHLSTNLKDWARLVRK